MSLTVSVAICNPQIDIFKRFLTSLAQFTPELSQLIIYHNNLDGRDESEIMTLAGQIIPQAVNLKIIHGSKGANIGFGAAHNFNLKIASGEYFAVLNDDIEFFETWSTQMIALLQSDSKIAQVGMKENTCSTWSTDGQGLPSEDEPEYVEASCMVMRTSLAREYGLFDEAYRKAYWEDGDLSLRLRKDGYILKNISLKWNHYRAATSSKIPVDIEGYHIRNEQVFKSRWDCYLKKRTFGKKIIIKRQGSLGDVFLISPIIHALRAKYPEDLIFMETNSPQMLLANSMIDGFVQWGSPQACDILIDLDYAYERDFRKHIITAYAEIAEVTPKVMHGIGYVDKARMDKVLPFIKTIPKPFVIIDMSITWKEKQWLQYGAIYSFLQEQGLTVVGIGNTGAYSNPDGIDPRKIPMDYNLLDMFDPLESMVAISEAKLFIGHEGLLAHIAQALKIPSVVLYGCTSPEYTNDLSLSTLYPVISPVGCQGCRHIHNAGVGVLCRRNAVCMKAIIPEMVCEAIINSFAKTE